MNDNASQPIPATVIPPREEVKQTEVHQYVQALIDVWKGANPEQHEIIDNPILDTMPPETVLGIIDACLP